MDWIQHNIAAIISGIVGILFGGLAGNIYAQYKTDRRNAKQRIQKGISINQIHKLQSSTNFKIAITEGGETHQFDNLYILTVRLKNIGNAPVDTFYVMLDLPENFKILKAIPMLKNRGQKIEFKTEAPTYNKPSNFVDFEISPFNREDSFSIDTQIFSSDNQQLDFSHINIETSNDLKFVNEEIFPEVDIEITQSFLAAIVHFLQPVFFSTKK